VGKVEQATEVVVNSKAKEIIASIGREMIAEGLRVGLLDEVEAGKVLVEASFPGTGDAAVELERRTLECMRAAFAKKGASDGA
jgi:hypothetical protein